MNTLRKVPSLPFALQRAAFAVLAVAITVLTTQIIVASATEPYYQPATAPAPAPLLSDSDGSRTGSITVALAR